MSVTAHLQIAKDRARERLGENDMTNQVWIEIICDEATGATTLRIISRENETVIIDLVRPRGGNVYWDTTPFDMPIGPCEIAGAWMHDATWTAANTSEESWDAHDDVQSLIKEETKP